MYQELLRTADRPFRATPDSKFYFPFDSIESARQTVERAIFRAEGPCLVMGAAGLGKSMLAQLIAEDLQDRFDIVRLHASALCSRRALLQNILFELDLPYRELSEGELRMSIMDRLTPSPETAPEGVLLIVDEAHTLPIKLLEELRLITNFARNGKPRARLVLLGSLRLEDTFASPQMESFNQRLAARCYLQPMNAEQTQEFVRHQFKCVHTPPQSMITSEALQATYAASEGIPRLVNQVMDHALVLAITNGQCPISAALIEESWADLQQLPAPWHNVNNTRPNERDNKTATTSIEFGTLDDENYAAEEFPKAATTNLKIQTEPVTASSTPLRTNCFEPACDESSCDESSCDESSCAESSCDETSSTSNTSRTTSASQANFFTAFAIPEFARQKNSETSHSELEPTPETDETPNTPVAGRVVFDAREAFGFSNTSSQNSSSAVNRNDQPETEIIHEKELRLAFSQEEDSLIANFQDTQGSAQPNAGINCDPLKYFGDLESEAEYLTWDESDKLPAPTPVDLQAYDDRGAWENDPPLQQPATHRAAANVDLFGADFDEEIPLAQESSDHTLSSSPQNSRQRAVAAAEEVAAMQAQVNRKEHLRVFEQPATFNEPATDDTSAEDTSAEDGQDLSSASPANRTSPTPANPPVLDNWTVDVTSIATDREIALHLEIEDLVSQLNFSAFSVEPFSVEQIDVDFSRPSAAPAAEVNTADERESVYRLHTNQSETQNDPIHSGLVLDDDRDMLIIEEELPVSSKNTAEPAPLPTKRAMPYSQLFAKLRH